MRSALGGTAAGLILIGLLGSACGGEDEGGASKSPAELCNESAVAICSQVYKCVPANLIALTPFPDNEPACVAQQKTSRGCDSVTVENACQGNETYHSDQAVKCVEQIKAASCSQILASQGNTDVVAPACNLFCTVG